MIPHDATMTATPKMPDTDPRRTAARRTALIVGIVAAAIFVLSIVGVWLNG
jgi:hypothetical protein